MRLVLIWAVTWMTPLAASAAVLDAAAVRSVGEKYRQLVQATYMEVTEKNRILNAEVVALARNPTEEQLAKAREAWKAARLVYSRTEAFRFYGGPIDQAETGAEPLLNAWPVDESYIDAVKGSPNAGIINNRKDFPKLDERTLIDGNGKGGERNVSTGYHAVEFLLWGQDFSTKSPGDRKAKEFASGTPGGTRRGEMLQTLTQLMVKQTTELAKAWEPGAPYAKAFLAEKPEEIMRRILVGATSLLADEMAGERLIVALEKNDPEHEQDCFSDFSLEDMKANHVGVTRVFTETGLDELFEKASKKEAFALRKLRAQTLAELEKIPAPLDRILLDPKNKDRRKVEKAIASLQREARAIDKVAKTWDVELNVQAE